MNALTLIFERKLGNVRLWGVTVLYILKYRRGTVASWNSEGVSEIQTVPQASV